MFLQMIIILFLISVYFYSFQRNEYPFFESYRSLIQLGENSTIRRKKSKIQDDDDDYDELVASLPSNNPYTGSRDGSQLESEVFMPPGQPYYGLYGKVDESCNQQSQP